MGLVRERSVSILIVGFTLLSTVLLLGLLTYASSSLSKKTETTTTTATGLHELRFLQQHSFESGMGCKGGQDYWVPWSITLSNTEVGNVTEAVTLNTTSFSYKVSCPGYDVIGEDGVSYYSTNESASSITFLVPYGHYSYEAVGPAGFGEVFGQVDFSPSNALPVGIDLEPRP